MPSTERELLDRFFDGIGRDIAELAREPEVLAWINEGIERLPARYPKAAAITWTAAASSVALPSDLVRFVRLDVNSGSYRQQYSVWGSALRFFDPLTASGSGTVFYFARFPRVTATEPSVVPALGEQAAIFYAQYRFFRKLAGSRADFRRYSTITGQSGLDVSDLDAVAERYHQDFLEARSEFEDTDLAEPATFYGD